MTSNELPLSADDIRRLKRVAKVARVMDTALRIPGTNFRFGLDAVVGLIPAIGDAGGGLIHLWVVNEARRLGLPWHKLIRMVGNVGIDVAVGTVPLVGDVFDAAFRASRRNLQMILDHFGEDYLEDHVMGAVDGERPMKDITPKRR